MDIEYIGFNDIAWKEHAHSLSIRLSICCVPIWNLRSSIIKVYMFIDFQVHFTKTCALTFASFSDASQKRFGR